VGAVGEEARKPLHEVDIGTAEQAVRALGTVRTAEELGRIELSLSGGRRVRLVTFSAGTFIGEVAMIDQSPRTATVIADDDLACLVLPRTGFDRLAGQSPGTAITITANLCRELAHRLRRTNRTLVELSR